MWKKNAIKIVVFLMLFVILATGITDVLKFQGDAENYNRIHGFYDRPKDSLDAVMIGTSSDYTMWIAPVGWNNHGITVYPFCTGGQPHEAAEYLVREARKTQPDALYIIDLDMRDTPFSEDQIQRILYFLPPSANKLKLTKELADMGEYSLSDRMEFYLPIIRFHTRWNELGQYDLIHDNIGYDWMGCRISGNYFRMIEDISSSYRTTTRQTELNDAEIEVLEHFLDYCDSEAVNVLFIQSLQAGGDETMLARNNAARQYVESRGYPVLALRDHLEETGVDLTRDFYNANHTNTHGAFKITDFLSNYLIENYGFKNKRGDPAYADWDYSYCKYVERASQLGCDYEWSGAPRDFSLKAPKMTKVAVDGATLTVSWEAVPDATGYCIYRKTAAGAFEPVADVDGKTLCYVDENCERGTAYTYMVVSFREQDGTRYWGTYDFTGQAATAVIDKPAVVVNTGVTDYLTLLWDQVPGADGYQINRRVFPKAWGMIADEVTKMSYTDTDMLEALPYEYAVRAYYYNDAGKPIYSGWTYTLYQPERPGPAVTAELPDGVPVLSWPAVEGISNYTVIRRTADGDWEQIAEPLAADCVQFQDITARAGESYEYQVTANIIYDGRTYPYPSEPVTITAEAGPTALDPPEILFCEQVGDTVQLVWEPSANATAYRVYRMAEGEDTWTMVNASIGGNTYQEQPSAAGTYTYLLQPLRTESGCVHYGTFDENAAMTAGYGVD